MARCKHRGWALWIDWWQWYCANCGFHCPEYALIGSVNAHKIGDLVEFPRKEEDPFLAEA